MKSFIKRIVARAAQNDFIWAILNASVVRLAIFSMHVRSESKVQSKDDPEFKILSEIQSMSPSHTVLHGPFKGMRYPEMRSVGSTLAPKILGSYERELHPLIEQLCENSYTEIIDVGCAEGYYAVGFAMRVPTAKVFAYDTDENATGLCGRMAKLNNVQEQLVIGSFCDADVLRSIPFKSNALIISDCEGYEKELFSEELVPIFKTHDLLIEVHDFIDIEISSEIRRRFADTHSITAIRSIDDITKAHTYDYDELREYSLAKKKLLLGECRPHIMEWLYMTPNRACVD